MEKKSREDEMSYFTYIASDYPLPKVERPDREITIEFNTETGLVFDGDYEDVYGRGGNLAHLGRGGRDI